MPKDSRKKMRAKYKPHDFKRAESPKKLSEIELMFHPEKCSSCGLEGEFLGYDDEMEGNHYRCLKCDKEWYTGSF